MEMEHVTPESVGVPSQAVLDLLDELYRYGIEMHGILLLRHGKIYAQGWWSPYNPQTPHAMFSFTKSLTSTAIGFAVQEGVLSLDDRLVDIFPDKIPENPSEHLRQCQVRHLLMMGCGHETEIPKWGDGDRDWISAFLHHPFVYKPGTHFLYNTAGTNLLSAILTRKTGLTLTQFLKPRLFDPLGMGDVSCYAMPDGTEMGGAGSYLTLDAMGRFTQFIANRGTWGGKRLLNEGWFDLATSKQIENNGPGWDGDPDWHVGYGFQFWRCDKPGVFRGDGAFGQFGVVLAQQDAVVVIQSASMRLQSVLNAVWDKLLPAFSDGPLPEDPHACHRLEKRLARLELNPMLGKRNPGAEASLHGAVYVPNREIPGLYDLVAGGGHFQNMGGKLERLEFVFQGDDARLLFHQDNGLRELRLGMTGHFVSSEIDGTLFGANGSWRAHNKLEVEIRNTRMTTGLVLVLEFNGSQLTLHSDLTTPEKGGLAGAAPASMTLTLQSGEINTKTKMYWEN